MLLVGDVMRCFAPLDARDLDGAADAVADDAPRAELATLPGMLLEGVVQWLHLPVYVLVRGWNALCCVVLRVDANMGTEQDTSTLPRHR